MYIVSHLIPTLTIGYALNGENITICSGEMLTAVCIEWKKFFCLVEYRHT